jgi:hypothetical protein
MFARIAGLKRRLGITAWREFSEDMTQVTIMSTLSLFNLFSDQLFSVAGLNVNGK